MAIVFIRKVFQMTVVSIVLVALATLIVIFSIGCSADANECMPLEVNYEIEDSGITISWNDVPCIVAINLTHYINGEHVTTMIVPQPLYQWPLSRISCSVNEVILQPMLLRAVDGINDVIVSFRAGIIGSGTIQGLNFNEDANRFEWIPPSQSENCNVEYQVNFKSDSTQLSEIVSEEFYDISVYPCSTNTIEVITLITFNDAESAPVVGSFIGPTTREALRHIRTNPAETSAEVRWEVIEETNFCQVENVILEVTEVEMNDVSQHTITFNNENYIDYTIEDLVPNVIHSYIVCYEFVGAPSVCSNAIRFLTEPLTDTSIVNIDQNADGISISWNQPYRSEFITGYLVHAQPEGPIHFIPNVCIVDLPPVITEHGPDINEYVIINPKPSFIYTLSVTTLFGNIGMTSQSYDEIVYTEEDTPGDVILKATYHYVPASQYNVNLVVEWDVPCDVNGKVETFTYKLIGTLKSELTSLCSDITLSDETISVIEQNQKTYSFEVANILPFFEYSVEITTNLADHFSTNTKLLDDPPQAFTPNT